MSGTQIKIPLITHQIWFQGWDKIPEKYRDNVRRLEELNPEFKHMKWDEHSLRRECEKLGKEYVDRYDSLDLMILKIDFGRYVVLYTYGGISVDTDMKPLRPLRETPGLGSERMIVSTMAFPYCYFNIVNNAIFITIPKHVIIKRLIDECMKNEKKKSEFMDDYNYVQAVTGPDILNAIVKDYKTEYTTIGYEYFEPCFSTDILCKPTPKTILNHQHAGSWFASWRFLVGTLLFLIARLFPLLLATAIILIAGYRPKWLPKSIQSAIKGSSK
jgi:mannosyltransferase OCH1-like enzyme